MAIDALLIGDSITAGFDTSNLLPRWAILNKGVSGDSTLECSERIEAGWFAGNPARVFICIGTNDCARDRSDDEILANISAIVGRVRSLSRADITLTSLFPTRGNEPRPNARIVRLNGRLAESAAAWNCSFLNLHPRFTDAAGELDAAYTDDGLHLTDAAYRLWARLLDEELRRR